MKVETMLTAMGMAVLLLAACESEPVHGTRETRPGTLVLYAHESRVDPSFTLVTSAAPSGNLSAANEEFGVVKVFSNVLKAGFDPNSTVLGSQVGIVVLGKDALNVYVSFTFALNNQSDFQGTIAVHGHIDGLSTSNRRYAVVGGTGDFLFATGQDEATYDAVIIDQANIVFTHTLTLGYLA